MVYNVMNEWMNIFIFTSVYTVIWPKGRKHTLAQFLYFTTGVVPSQIKNGWTGVENGSREPPEEPWFLRWFTWAISHTGSAVFARCTHRDRDRNHWGLIENVFSFIIIFVITIYRPNNTTVCTSASIQLRRAGQERSDKNTDSCHKTFNNTSYWIHILPHK